MNNKKIALGLLALAGAIIGVGIAKCIKSNSSSDVLAENNTDRKREFKRRQTYHHHKNWAQHKLR